MEAYAQLLGAPRIRLAEIWYDPPLNKATALLFYLAYKGEWCSRDELLFLFYPDAPEAIARANLRQRLVSVRRLPYSEGLEVEAGRLRWPVETDVQAFKKAVQEANHAKTVELYRGRLLEGCSLSDAPEFEAWLEAERESLHSQWRDAVFALVKGLEGSGRYSQAAELLERLYKTDPLDEEVLRHYLQALYLSGQRSKALAVFASFKKQLQEEYDGESEDATLQLIEQIERNEHELQPAIPPSRASDGTQEPRHKLPTQPTPFVGREDEKEKLSQLLSDPSCRLLTIIGPGGMGKTRLVIETAREQLESFQDGVYFVNFVPVASPELMVYAIGDAVGFSFFGQQSPEEQLLDFLGSKDLLLVLDNLEHLLSGVELVSELLEHAPNIKLLATSRERLNLQAEWVYDLRGLAFPEAGEGAQAHDAVKLFAQRASSVRHDFVLDDATLPAIIRICQLVRGMPLALELAASWLRSLTLTDIAQEIEKGIFFLETSARDVPKRHRSIRAVFDYSWRLLTEEEQQVLRKLSVFRGGFRRQAAAEVAGASLPVLAALVDKSFLTFTPAGRYRRHPLVIRYTQEKLSEQPEEKKQVHEGHSQYYLHFAKEREKVITTKQGKEALRAIEEELPNLRVAWTWLIENERVDEVKTYALVLDRIFRYRLPEGVTFFAQAVDGLDASNPEHHVALGYAFVIYGFHLQLLAREKESYGCARHALELLQPLGDKQGIMRAKFLLGLQHWRLGETSQARTLLEESHALSREYPKSLHTGIILYFHVIVEWEFGTLAQVRQFFEEAIAEVEPLDDPNLLAMLKQEYGLYLAWHDFVGEGESLVREGLELIRESNALGLEAGVLANLALIIYKLGKYDEAEALALEAVASAEKLYGKQGAVLALIRLGRIMLARENYPEAQRYLKEALQIGWALQNLMHGLEILFRLAELDFKQGKAVEAAKLLGLVQQQSSYSAFESFHRHDVRRLLEHLQKQLPTAELEEALACGKQMKLEEVVPELLETL